MPLSSHSVKHAMQIAAANYIAVLKSLLLVFSSQVVRVMNINLFLVRYLAEYETVVLKGLLDLKKRWKERMAICVENVSQLMSIP